MKRCRHGDKGPPIAQSANISVGFGFLSWLPVNLPVTIVLSSVKLYTLSE